MTLHSLPGYAHGAFWKVLALLAKAAFVFLIIPRLADGVFGGYSLASTITMLVAVGLSLGALDALPVFTRGRKAIERSLAPLFHMVLIAAGLCLAAYAIVGGIVSIAAAVAAANLSYLILSGILRSSRPHYYELLINLPIPLFVGLCAFLLAPDLERLLLQFALAHLAVVIAIGACGGLLSPSSHRQRIYSISIARRLLKTGNIKSVSAILLLVDFRALILVPGILFATVPADTLAMALTLAEAVWQLGMVVVNRNYSLYCKGVGTLRDSVRTACLLLTCFVLLGCAFILLPIPFTIRRFDWHLIGWALLFFAAMISLLELRYFFWSRGQYDYQIVLAQVVIASVQVVVVATLPEQFWLPASALMALAGTVALLAHLLRTKLGLSTPAGSPKTTHC
ncbi:hypothetical protein [Bradyrhizobium sp. USDA 3650]